MIMATDAVVHLIDDDAAVRQALSFLLATAGYAVRVYESADAFLHALPALPRGCVVTDIRMPGTDGMELQRQLQTRAVNMPVIVMTGHGDVKLAVQAMKAGAVDFIEKPFDDETLLDSIRIAVARQARNAAHEGQVAAVAAKMTSLSHRERAVLTGLVAGQANKAIARELQISARTVEVHRANLMTKMGASSLSDLVRMAYLAGQGAD
jgi:two-component system response regulator FixJ